VSTTQLFVELLVIGFGTLVALGLIVAAVCGLDFRCGLPQLDVTVAAVLAAPAYVLGIIVDRLARLTFSAVEDWWGHVEHLERPGVPPLPQLERLVLSGHPVLEKQIQYNRSRLRIARAWAINFLLIAISFALWNGRVERLPPTESALLVLAALLLSLLSAWVASRLYRDHCRNLAEGYAFLESRLAIGNEQQ
jgi:hypothetical protein